MDEADRFAFLLPVTLLCFGVAFLVAWRNGSRAAFWWAFSYIIQSLAFVGEPVLADMSDQARTMILDAMFLVGFFGFAQALLIQFRLPRHLAPYLAAGLGAYALVAYAVFVADSLRGELLAVDLGCALLVLLPLVALGRLPAKPTERGLFLATGLNVVNLVVQVVVYAAVASAEASFATYTQTGYFFASQVTATFVTLIFGLMCLAAVTVDMVDVYRDAAERDPLSGLLNRRGFEIGLPAFAAGTAPAGAVVVCDIDRFKRVNDTFGHAAGDRVIAALAETLGRRLPEGALAARFGGEEFVVFLPFATLGMARLFAEDARCDFAQGGPSAAGVEACLTASFGVASLERADRSVHDALARADRRLYAAKLAGRDRVVADDPPAAAQALVTAA